MAIYKRTPISFSVKSTQTLNVYQASFLPFLGLQINDNPFVTESGSASDMLNLVVDDDAYLTVRPRIIYDPEYTDAVALLGSYLSTNLLTYSVVDRTKLKDGYLFLLQKIDLHVKPYALAYVINGVVNFIQDTDESAYDAPIQNLGNTAGYFSGFMIFAEKDYTRFVLRTHLIDTTLSLQYKLIKVDGAWSFIELSAYIPTYKMAIKDLSTLSDTSIYEDLNILSPTYKISISYSETSSIDLDYLAKNAVSVSGSAYYAKEHIEDEARGIIYHDDDGYLYFQTSDYTSAIHTASGSSYNLIFYYYDFTTKSSSQTFVIKVYGDYGTYSDGISKTNLATLYSSDTSAVDANGRRTWGFMYDSSTNMLVRATAFINSTYQMRVFSFSISDKVYTNTLVASVNLSAPLVQATMVSRIFYCNGAIFFHVVDELVYEALVMMTTADLATYALIGAFNDNDSLALAGNGFGAAYDGKWAIQNVFIANQTIYILSNMELDYLTSQYLASGTDNILTETTDGTILEKWNTDNFKEHIGARVYYSVSSYIDTDYFSNTQTLTGISVLPDKTYVSVNGDQALIYSKKLLGGATAKATDFPVIRLPISTLNDTASLSFGSLASDLDGKTIWSIGITTWGAPMLFVVDEDTNCLYIKVDMDSSISRGYVLYNTFSLGLTADHILETVGIGIYLSSGSFDFVNSGSVYQILVSDDLIEYEYSIANNDNNPLKIPQDIIDSYNELRQAFIFDGDTNGTALIDSSRIYYNETYLFLTEPDNYDYIPTIQCHKAAQPLRFASSYMQTTGVAYERNNIEYISFADNSLSNYQYQAHSEVATFSSVEQRAIDYNKNGHIVDFTGNTIYLTDSGIYRLNFDADTPQDTERKATSISKNINSRLLKEDLSTCIMANLDPYVLFMFPKEEATTIYAYKLLSGYWFYWEIPFVVKKAIDDNAFLRLVNDDEYVVFNDEPVAIDIPDSVSYYKGAVENYRDFDIQTIKWFWKSQIIALGSVTSKKQILETFFTFLNSNANIAINPSNYEVNKNKIATEKFGLRFYSFRDMVNESPVVAFEDNINIANILRKRTYLNRFKFCQLLCYNIEDGTEPSDKVRIADITISYRYLSGGK